MVACACSSSLRGRVRYCGVPMADFPQARTEGWNRIPVGMLRSFKSHSDRKASFLTSEMRLEAFLQRRQQQQLVLSSEKEGPSGQGPPTPGLGSLPWDTGPLSRM